MSLSIIWLNTHLTPVVFTIFGFPRIRFLFNFILFWILGIRYGLCTGHLNTDRGEAACFQKLLTSIKRQYNTSKLIIPKMKRADDCIFLPLAKKQYLVFVNVYRGKEWNKVIHNGLTLPHPDMALSRESKLKDGCWSLFTIDIIN